MKIVGGTYSEVCFEPIWENIFGSGFRAVNLLLENYPSLPVTFHTAADEEIKSHLDYCARLHRNLTLDIVDITKSPEFHYDHPLKTPTIYPRPDLYRKEDISVRTHGENILAYGLLEASIEVKGNKVVYDPQSPANPIPFKSTRSSADELITIINRSEAIKIAGSNEPRSICKYFFEEEKCHALILKMGAKGALLYDSAEKDPTHIPVFRTNKVWPIGSGDVFSAYFAFNWFKGLDLRESAVSASKATAIYCNSQNLGLSANFSSFAFSELIITEIPGDTIYLAGPFFTYSQRWLINEIWSALKGFGLNVFSPFHDVGHGKARDVVDKDLEGLNNSKVIFAVIDGLDSGTLFEVGYAIAQNKTVVAFVQNEGEESLKMLEGTNCIIEKDLTTSIYKTYWALASS